MAFVLTVMRKIFALVLLLGVGWVLYIYNFSGLRQNISTTDQRSPNAMLVMAEGEALPEVSLNLAIRALSKDPTHGGAAAFLLGLAVAQEKDTDAAMLADLASNLWPVDTYTQARVADYWIAEDRVDKLIPVLHVLLVRERDWRSRLFPVLQELTVSSGQLDLLAPYITEPPNWWDSFFAYISERVDREIVLAVYKQRLESSVAISELERSRMVSRLIRDKQWGSAFEQWQRGLGLSQAGLLFNGLYDGGFEGEKSNQKFGWNIKHHKAYRIHLGKTYGMTGKKALQLSFKQGLNRIAFKHLSQYLLLEPGDYELQYRARTDALKNPKGLQWRVSCTSKKLDLLGEGQPLLGRKPWESRSFKFRVPHSCGVQSLSLEAVSSYPHELFFYGTLWLDDVEIVSLPTGAN